MVTAAFLLCVGGGVAAQKVDINQLKGLDVPEGLKEVIGSMMLEMQWLKNQNQMLQNAVEAELRNETLVEEELRGEISWLKSDRDAFQNETRVVEAELRKENAALWIKVTELQNQTETNSARLDQCEIDTHPFIKEMERRRMQDEETLCRGSGLSAMFAACCPTSGGNGGHRRFLQSQGCDVLPNTCPSDCAPLFIAFFEGCQIMINDLSPAEQQEFAALYTDCNEVEQQSAMANLQPVDVKMFRITINQEAEQQAAMANSGSSAPSPPFGPVVLPPSGSPPAPSPGPTEVQEYHAQCTTQNIMTCVPDCNATHHGFELLATIDGTDTKFSCTLANMLFSWVGAAALGGYLGRNVQAFVSAVISGAVGTYVLTLDVDADVGTDLVVQPGQNVIISGDAGLAPSWGSGGFTVQERGVLSMEYVGLTGKLALETGGHISLIDIFLTTDSGRSPLSGTAVMDSDGSYRIDPPELRTLDVFFTGTFTVISGPCTISDRGRCVGRAGGYGPSEACAIIVGGGGGVLGACGVFDTDDYHGDNGGDHLTMPDGSTHGGSECPVGMVLSPGGSVGWASDNQFQGSVAPTSAHGICHDNPHGICYDNGCGAKGLCGLPYGGQYSPGGGWQICFA
eukprot:SAG31_NODE_968_length_10678_cov_4.493619_3_plen_625_part_00